jgi:hypothetical protein
MTDSTLIDPTYYTPPRIHSSCKIEGRTNVYTYWASDTDLMVRVWVDMNWPPANGRRIQAVHTRHDSTDGPFRPAEVPQDLLATMPARSAATHLINEHRNTNR